MRDPEKTVGGIASKAKFACLSGRVEVLETEEAKARVWREGDERYYPQGPGDPDYCVLKFTAEKGRYYSNFKNEDFDIPV